MVIRVPMKCDDTTAIMYTLAHFHTLRWFCFKVCLSKLKMLTTYKTATQAFTSDITDCLVCIFYYLNITFMIKFTLFKRKDKNNFKISVISRCDHAKLKVSIPPLQI